MSLEKLGFKKATKRDLYFRVLVFGESFTGKSTFALSWPRPAVFDFEGGLDYVANYGIHDMETGEPLSWVNTDFMKINLEEVEFENPDISIPKYIMDILQEMLSLAKEGEEIPGTIIFDPFTRFWEELQADYVKEKKSRFIKEDDIYQTIGLNPFDWRNIKQPLKKLFAILDKLPAHKIYTAHSSSVFVQEIVNGQMQLTEAGKTAKTAGDLYYHVDVIIEMLKKDDPRNTLGKFGVGLVHKDRTQRFKVGDLIEDPRYELWAGATIKEPQKSINRAKKKPVEQYSAIVNHPEVQKFAKKLGLTDEQLLAGVKKYKSLDATIEALKKKVEEQEGEF